MNTTRGTEDFTKLVQTALRQRGFRAAGKKGIERRTTVGPYQALPPVRRYWLEDVMDGRVGLNVLTCRIAVPLGHSLNSLSERLHDITSRTETLRCVFRWEDGMVVAVPQVHVTPILLTFAPGEVDAKLAEKLDTLRMSAPQPPWRAIVEIMDGEVKTLIVQAHHALLDWHALGLLAAELLSDAQPHASSVLSPGDASAWWATRGGEVEQETAYWCERLKDLPPPAPIVAARKDGSRMRRLHLRETSIPDGLRESIIAFALKQQTTPFTVLVCLYAMLLERFTGSSHVTVGTSISHREIPGTEALVGCLSDLIPLRFNLSGEKSFRSIVEDHRASFARDLANSRLGYEQLKSAASGVVASPERPFFDYLFGMMSFDPALPPGTLKPLPALVPRANIALDIFEYRDSWTVSFEFDGESVPVAVADAIAEGFLALAAAAVAEPEQSSNMLNLMVPYSLLQDQKAIQAPEPELPAPGLAAWLLSSLLRHGDSPLLLENGSWKTAREVLRRAEELSAQLKSAGIQPGMLLAICLPRSAELVATVVATIQTGAVFLLLDPDHPAERNRHILRDSQAGLLVTAHSLGLETGHDVPLMLAYQEKGIYTSEWKTRPPHSEAYRIYTSGSTGEPKSVRGREAGLLMRLHWGINALPADHKERACLKTSPAFVDFLAEMLQPLLSGLPMVIAGGETARTPELLARLINVERITRLTVVPTMLRALLDVHESGEASLDSLQFCICSGETLTAGLAERFARALPHARLVNLYGSSEVSGDVTANLNILPSSRLSIGWPLPGAGVWLVDSAGHPVPQGAVGEILVTGPFVALGYSGGVTARDFGSNGAPTFRTGDLGFWIADEGIILLGRKDRQVKISGVRIECGEIENRILEFPGIREACVVPVHGEDGSANMRLWAYVVSKDALDERALRLFLMSRLPRGVLPAGFTQLSGLPLGPTGKLNRGALPAPAGHASSAFSTPSPIAPDQQWLAELWRDVLGRPVVRADADFFRLGGASIGAIRLSHKVSAKTGKEVPVSILFTYPTFAGYAEALSQAASRETSELIANSSATALPDVLPGGSNESYPATPNQIWLWDRFKTDPTSPAFNLAAGYVIDGAIDPDLLESALSQLASRHPGLRTTLTEEEGKVRQRIHPPHRKLLSIEHLAEGAGKARIDALARVAFDLESDLPIRAHLLVHSRSRATLAIIMNHVAVDGWSGQILLEDLARTLRGEDLPAADLPPPLAVHANWYAEKGPEIRALIPEYLAGIAGSRAPAPPGMRHQDRSDAVAALKVIIPPTITLALHDAARAAGVTPFQIVTALWCTLMHRVSELDRPLVGIVQAGRARPESAEIVGFLANITLIAPHLLGEHTLQQALEVTRTEIVKALKFQDIPLSWVQGSGYWPTGEAGSGLACVVLEQSLSQWALEIQGRHTSVVMPATSPAARVDIALIVTHDSDRQNWVIEYAPSRVPLELAERLAVGLAELADAFAAQAPQPLSCLAMGPPNGARSILSAPPVAEGSPRLEDLLTTLASRSPDAIILTDSERQLSAAALASKSASLCHLLRQRGVRGGTRVGLALAPGADQIALLLAIWQAGASAVLIDPAWPEHRQERALALAGADLIVRDIGTLDEGPHLDASSAADLAPINASPVAAIIFTSGTTGQPKGISIEHGALCRLGVGLRDLYRLTASDRILQTVSPAFDAALSDLAMALDAGAELLAMPRTAVMPGRSLTDTLARFEVSVMQVTAAVLHATEAVPLPKLRLIAVGGEALKAPARRAWSAGRELLCVYGPTEATVTVSAAKLDADSPNALIGWPVAGSSLAVVDQKLEPVPPGIPGELLIGGANLSPGYVADAEETAVRFVERAMNSGDAAHVMRWYRSGDRAVYLPGYGLVFLGRVDRQMKVRGIRFEPAGLETLLEQLPGVKEAHVDLVTADKAALPLLCAWISTEDGYAREDLAREARRMLRRQLPEALVPSQVILVAAFPLTQNGKIDRSALPMPGLQASTAPAQSEQRHDMEGLVRSLWRELLHTDSEIDGMTFFDAGGHSLLIVKLQQRLETELATHISIAEFFAAPTIKDMADMLSRHLSTQVTEQNGHIEEYIL